MSSLTTGDAPGFAGEAAGEADGDATGVVIGLEATTVAVGLGVAGLFSGFGSFEHAPARAADAAIAETNTSLLIVLRIRLRADLFHVEIGYKHPRSTDPILTSFRITYIRNAAWIKTLRFGERGSENFLQEILKDFLRFSERLRNTARQ